MDLSLETGIVRQTDVHGKLIAWLWVNVADERESLDR
jgi:hypothetical protein